MLTFFFILSLYSAILSTFLFIWWVRRIGLKRKLQRQIEKNDLSPEKARFIAAHPPNPIADVVADIVEEMEGEVVRGIEVELDREENEGVEESVEEREYREEELIKQKRGARR